MMRGIERWAEQEAKDIAAELLEEGYLSEAGEREVSSLLKEKEPIDALETALEHIQQ